MKVSVLLGLIVLTLVHAESKSKRRAYDLPFGTELLVDDVKTAFVCKKDGYYADQANFCKIFHRCHTVFYPDGTSKMMQWSFLCGNRTIFNQFSLTCSYPEDAVPCGIARNFWYLNARLGAGPNVPFHNDQDVYKAAAVVPGRAAHLSKPQHIQVPPRPPTPMPIPNRRASFRPLPAREAPRRPKPHKDFQG